MIYPETLGGRASEPSSPAVFDAPADTNGGRVLLNPEQMKLALQAMDIFEQAFDETGAYGHDYNGRAASALQQGADELGVEQLAEGFKLMRMSFGEVPYEGMEIVYSESEERTPIDEYLKLVQDGKLIINHWNDRHDFRDHLAGGLIASAELKKVLALGASAALGAGIDEFAKGRIATDLDFCISKTRFMWEWFSRSDQFVNDLAVRINLVYENAQMPMTDDKALAIAERQLQAIKDWHFKVRSVAA